MIRLTAEDLVARRGGRTVFEGVSFAVRAGETLAVTGPNGAGKSTLLRLIAGLLTPVSGRISLEPTPKPGSAAPPTISAIWKPSSRRFRLPRI